ncbi:MAG TPA: BBP7 family outer membrane beta-barrel protein [Gemmataceae bacterium]|nr:BBP7 family outer membrane beta-barrel protein [Gemmataceae bacterium]
MKKRVFAALGAVALCGTAAVAQSPAPTPQSDAVPTAAPKAAATADPAPAAAPVGPLGDHGPDLVFPGPEAEADNCRRMTFSADYLLWWVKKGPSGGPLVTAGSTSDPIPGALGQPNTHVLFGDGGFDYHAASGLRLGGSFGLGSGLSVDGNYFVLERRSVNFSAASDPDGNPFIARPIINDHNGIQESYTTSFPGQLAGQIDVSSHTQLQGYEINLAANLSRGEGSSLDIFVGYRYLNLREDLLFRESLTPLTPGFLSFDHGPADPPDTVADFDGFHTRNHFYGGQVGARWQQCFGKFDVGVTGKLALGANSQQIVIDGVSTLNVPGVGVTTAPGGLLAQTSNGGAHSRTAFSVVPELGVNVGWQVTPWLNASVGYTFLYWSDVVRPGAQIDSRVSPFRVPTDQDFGTAPGSGHPAFGFHSSDFWAQGLNFGITLRF